MLYLDNSVIPLTINFQAEHSGRYICQIILRAGERAGRGAGNQLSAGDVRVFQIGCIVSPQGNKATIDFASPISIPVVQNIPIVSHLFLRGVFQDLRTHNRAWLLGNRSLTPIASGRPLVYQVT